MGVGKTISYLKEIQAVAAAQEKVYQIAGRLWLAVDEFLAQNPLLVAAEGPMLRTSDKMGGVGSAAQETVRKFTSTSTKELFKFSLIAAKRMDNASRMIPVQILDEVIKNPMHILWCLSNASMYYSQVWVNKKLYNVEVLYDKLTNTISHFLYRQDRLGPLPKINSLGRK